MTTATKLTARQAWLSVALGVADGLPHPKLLQVLHDPDQAVLTLLTATQARRWVDWLDEVTGEVEFPIPGGVTLQSWRGRKDGWHYTVDVAEPSAACEPDEKAKARLAAALLSPDEEA